MKIPCSVMLYLAPRKEKLQKKFKKQIFLGDFFIRWKRTEAKFHLEIN